MPSQAEMIITYLFKRSGKKSISYSEFYLTLSMELNWFTPDKAKKFVDFAIENNLLLKNEDIVNANFDISKVKIPLGYSPSGDLFVVEKEESKLEKNVLEDIVDDLVKIIQKGKNEILKEISDVESEKNITKELAALLLCKKYNVDFDKYILDIENLLI